MPNNHDPILYLNEEEKEELRKQKEQDKKGNFPSAWEDHGIPKRGRK